METDQIRRVRSFNRTVTQRIGALNSSFLDRGRPLGEARLLYEIGPDGRDVSVLREKLALDSGYLSRLLRSLEGQGLVRTRRRGGDGRGRYVEPTRTGIDELEEYERRSDGFAKSLLLPLSSNQRDRLVAAMFPCGDDRGAGYFVGLICGGARPAALSSAMIWRKHSMPYSVKAVTPSLPRP